MGQERQFVAEPAASGLRALRNRFRFPVEEMNEGTCGVPAELGEAGEQSSHMRKSMSWQDLVSSDGAAIS